MFVVSIFVLRNVMASPYMKVFHVVSVGRIQKNATLIRVSVIFRHDLLSHDILLFSVQICFRENTVVQFIKVCAFCSSF